MSITEGTPSGDGRAFHKKHLPGERVAQFVLLVDEAGNAVSLSGKDREVVVTTYTVKTAFAGAAVGNTITCTQVLDVSGEVPSTLATLWRNHSTAADLAGAPAAANLTLVGEGAATAAHQLTLIGRLPASLGTKPAAESLAVVLPADQPDLSVKAAARTVLFSDTIALASGTIKTLAELIGQAIPAGAQAVELQALNGSVIFTRNSSIPSAVKGYRLDDGLEKYVDTPLAALRFFVTTGTTYVNVVIFDKA